MPVTVIVGGQFGSEGKGKVTYFLADKLRAKAVIRVGGPNSGHTIIDQMGNPVIFKQLSAASLLNNVICVISAGSYINLESFFHEINISGLTPDRILIDPNAVVITEKNILTEQKSGLKLSIGSTNSGTGAAVLSRIYRDGDVRLACDEPILKSFVRPVIPILRNILNNNERIIIEGTQGFGLSLLHTPYYPYATSRDTTAAGFVSEVGLSPLDIDDIVMVIRTFPIRVSGNSGPLKDEVTWDYVTKFSNSSKSLIEFTSVTKKQRRIAMFDPEIVRHAIIYNRPTQIVLNHLDYIDSECGITGKLTEKTKKFINAVESEIESKINYVGLGRETILSLEN